AASVPGTQGATLGSAGWLPADPPPTDVDNMLKRHVLHGPTLNLESRSGAGTPALADKLPHHHTPLTRTGMYNAGTNRYRLPGSALGRRSEGCTGRRYRLPPPVRPGVA